LQISPAYRRQGWRVDIPLTAGLKSEMKKKRLLLLILISLLILGSLTFFGEKGIFSLFRLRKEVARVKEKNLRLEEENQKLKEEVKRLQSDKRYLEEIARKELGMVKEGEILYRFDTPSKGREHSK
jgi:cell division protein FtsB/cell division protein DivIC